METERGDLPAEILDLAPGDPREPVADERVLDLGDFRVELRGALVPAGERGLLAGQEGSRPTKPLGHEPETLAVRLVPEPPPPLAVELPPGLRGAGRSGGQRAGGPPRGDRRGPALG